MFQHTGTLECEQTMNGWLYRLWGGSLRRTVIIWYKEYHGDKFRDNQVLEELKAYAAKNHIEILAFNLPAPRENINDKKNSTSKTSFLRFERTTDGWLCTLRRSATGNGIILWFDEYIGDDPAGSIIVQRAYEWAEKHGVIINGIGGPTYSRMLKKKRLESK